MKEYAFDTTMNAVVRIKAPSEELARSHLEAVHDAMQIGTHFIDGYNSRSAPCVLVDASLSCRELGL